MSMELCKVEGTDVVVVEAEGVVIRDAQDALDLIGTVGYAHESHKVVLDKTYLAEEFFSLRTGLAGEILQKFTTYGCSVAIFGDFSVYDSKSLRDFIYESNKGRQVFFAPDKQSAIDHLRNLA